jgi:hypothetical protein
MNRGQGEDAVRSVVVRRRGKRSRQAQAQERAQDAHRARASARIIVYIPHPRTILHIAHST